MRASRYLKQSRGIYQIIRSQGWGLGKKRDHNSKHFVSLLGSKICATRNGPISKTHESWAHPSQAPTQAQMPCPSPELSKQRVIRLQFGLPPGHHAVVMSRRLLVLAADKVTVVVGIQVLLASALRTTAVGLRDRSDTNGAVRSDNARPVVLPDGQRAIGHADCEQLAVGRDAHRQHRRRVL